MPDRRGTARSASANDPSSEPAPENRDGFEEYLAAHIPGAIFVHLDADLSAPRTGTNGRHPLPTPEQAASDPATPDQPCPCCGSAMRIIEVFEAGELPRHRPTAMPATIRIDTS